MSSSSLSSQSPSAPPTMSGQIGPDNFSSSVVVGATPSLKLVLFCRHFTTSNWGREGGSTKGEIELKAPDAAAAAVRPSVGQQSKAGYNNYTRTIVRKKGDPPSSPPPPFVVMAAMATTTAAALLSIPECWSIRSDTKKSLCVLPCHCLPPKRFLACSVLVRGPPSSPHRYYASKNSAHAVSGQCPPPL